MNCFSQFIVIVKIYSIFCLLLTYLLVFDIDCLFIIKTISYLLPIMLSEIILTSSCGMKRCYHFDWINCSKSKLLTTRAYLYIYMQCSRFFLFKCKLYQLFFVFLSFGLLLLSPFLFKDTLKAFNDFND